MSSTFDAVWNISLSEYSTGGKSSLLALLLEEYFRSVEYLKLGTFADCLDETGIPICVLKMIINLQSNFRSTYFRQYFENIWSCTFSSIYLFRPLFYPSYLFLHFGSVIVINFIVVKVYRKRMAMVRSPHSGMLTCL